MFSGVVKKKGKAKMSRLVPILGDEAGRNDSASIERVSEQLVESAGFSDSHEETKSSSVRNEKRDTPEKASPAKQRVAKVAKERPKVVRPPLPETPVAPWKLNANTVLEIKKAGYQISSDVEIDNYDQGLYALDEYNHVNSFFLGLDSGLESTTHLHDLLFDSEGDPRMEADPDSYIEDGGNLSDVLTPRGPFIGMRQLILRGENIRDVLSPGQNS